MPGKTKVRTKKAAPSKKKVETPKQTMEIIEPGQTVRATTKTKVAPTKEALGKATASAGQNDAATHKPKHDDFKKQMSALFQPRQKVFTLGISLPRPRNLARFVAWPRYVRVARQKMILTKRLKCPPAINMFNQSLDKATAVSLFKLMAKMRPEEVAARKKRRLEGAKRLLASTKPVEGKKLDPKQRAAARREVMTDLVSKRPVVLSYGLNNITKMIIRKKAQLVVIASDVDPIELVLWLPALCRRNKVPFCIVKNKARLGQLVHRKTCSVVAFSDIPKELRADFTQLVAAIRPQFLENTPLFRQWGEPHFGLKHKAREIKRLRRIARAESVKK